MNIFTKIRYPVDITFRVEDLERLPDTVLEVWWLYATLNLYAHDNRARIPCNSARIHAYINNSTRKDIRVKLLDKLNELIAAWDESDKDYKSFILKHSVDKCKSI